MREKIESIEKDRCIEKSDTMIAQEYNLIYKPPVETDEIFTIYNKPPLIEMKLEMPILEKQIKEKGMHPNAKSPSKVTKRKSKKNHSSIQ